MATLKSKFLFAGLYRVNYDENNWKLLEQTLANEDDYNKIEVLSRVQLLADSLGLAWIGKLDYERALNIVQYLQHETEYLPWRTGLSSLREIAAMLRRTPAFGYFKVLNFGFAKNYVRRELEADADRPRPNRRQLAQHPRGYDHGPISAMTLIRIPVSPDELLLEKALCMCSVAGIKN